MNPQEPNQVTLESWKEIAAYLQRVTGFEGVGSIRTFDISPDGSRIAYSSDKPVQEVWALDNVLSAIK
jgi:WD40-like Beta Propeller Repeat